MVTKPAHFCDWCEIEVGEKREGLPGFAAKITAQPVAMFSVVMQTMSYDVCTNCFSAFEALKQGKFRRVG